MGDDEYGEIGLNQYGMGGRWTACPNHSWTTLSPPTDWDGIVSCEKYPRQKISYVGDGSSSVGFRSIGSSRSRGRSSVYYSPPGAGNHPPYAEASNRYLSYHSSPVSSSSPSSHSPRSTRDRSGGSRRPMSPEDVLKMFQTSKGKGSSRRVQSAASSPAPRNRTICNRHFLHQNTHDDAYVRTVSMKRSTKTNHGFGICVKGGKDMDDIRTGVYISRVEEGSVAEKVGLRPGDSILEVNGTPFNGISHEDALRMLKSCDHISMTVQSTSFPRSVPRHDPVGEQYYQNRAYSWMDRDGRPVSPPLEHFQRPVLPLPRWAFMHRPDHSLGTRKVDLNIENGQSLGLMIRGGLEYNLGIFITGVDKDSVAERAGLKVGDQILEVNGQSFQEVTHDEAVHQLKIHKRMKLVVRDVGKVPHSCTAYDEFLWQPCFTNILPPRAIVERDMNPAHQMVEQKAKALLNANEQKVLYYHEEEYLRRHIDVESFVSVLLDLLDTPEKRTLLTELREIIDREDRARFDDMVYSTVPSDTDYQYTRQRCENWMGVPALPMYRQNEYSGGSKACKIPVMLEGMPLETEEYNTPSEDSGVCLGDNRTNERASWISSSSPAFKKQTSDLALPNGGCSNVTQTGYFDGLKSQFDGWTQRVKSWYWGRPLDYSHKMGRSFEMKEDPHQSGGNPRRHQSGQRMSRGEVALHPEEEDPLMGSSVVPDHHGNLRVTVSKTKPILGIAIEGGINTRHPLPRIINIHENGSAYESGGLEVGQLILEVDGQKVDGLQHQEIARIIAEAFARKEKPEIEFLVVEAKKSNLEPKPTALIFLEA